jgi:hypothetical protein
LLTDRKTFFSMRSFISFCLNTANSKRTICTTESNLMMTARANIEIEAKMKAKAKSRSSIVLNTKLKYAVDAKYFRKRSRSRFNEKISNSDFWSIKTTSWSSYWNILDDFEINAMNEKSMIEIKSDEFSRWLSS